MKAAVEQICEIGSQTFQTHRMANDKAAETADQWKLTQRLEDERSALGQLFDSVRSIVEALERTRQLVHEDDVVEATLHQSLRDTAKTIDDGLPKIEDSLLSLIHI